MKRQYLTFAAFVLVFGFVFQALGTEKNEPRKTTVPDIPTLVKGDRLNFSFPDLEGKTVSMVDEKFRGKVVLVTIWGTWCPPCRKEIPTLKKLHEKYRSEGLEIVAVAFETPSDSARARLKQFVKDQGIEYTVLHGGHRFAIADALPGVENFVGTPTSFFIGRDGLVKHIDGDFDPEITPSLTENTILELLKEPAPKS